MSLSTRRVYLVCYDVSSDRARARVFKVLRNYGDHLQFSVFECQLSKTSLLKCRHEIKKVISHGEDQVLFVDLGAAKGDQPRTVIAIGRPYQPMDAPCLVVDHEHE